MSGSNPAKRVAALIGGGLVLLVGVALLVLPGPGLLLVLGGLLILANEFPAVEKYVDPVAGARDEGRRGKRVLAAAHSRIGARAACC